MERLTQGTLTVPILLSGLGFGAALAIIGGILIEVLIILKLVKITNNVSELCLRLIRNDKFF